MLNYVLIHPAQCGGWDWNLLLNICTAPDTMFGRQVSRDSTCMMLNLLVGAMVEWSPMLSPSLLRNNPEWHYKEIQTNHCGQIVDPELVSETLIEIPQKLYDLFSG